MNLLTAALYDPAVAVTKATSALLAMTAVDTTNLRCTFTVPPGGRVRVRIVCILHGATTFPAILLGVMNGATVVGRVAPTQDFSNVATAFATCIAEFVVPGLTPAASLTWDAAYGVETLVAATGIKYGGPNDTTANNAFGAFCFEIWDVSPIYLTAAVPTASVDAKLGTLNTNDTTIAGYIDTEVAAIKAKTDQLTFTVANKVDASDTAGTTTLLTRVPGVVPVATDYSAARAAKLDNLDASVSSRSTVTSASVASAANPPTRRRVLASPQ